MLCRPTRDSHLAGSTQSAANAASTAKHVLCESMVVKQRNSESGRLTLHMGYGKTQPLFDWRSPLGNFKRMVKVAEAAVLCFLIG